MSGWEVALKIGLGLLDLVARTAVIVWMTCLAAALVRQMLRGRYVGPFALVGHVWRGEVGPRERSHIITPLMIGLAEQVLLQAGYRERDSFEVAEKILETALNERDAQP